MEADWFRTQQGFRNRRRRRRKRAYRAGGGLLRTSGYDYLKDRRNDFNVESDSACSNNIQKEESSSCQSSYDKTSVKPREEPMDKEIPREAEIRWSSSSVIAKLMGLDEQPAVRIVNKQKEAIITREQHLPRISMAEHQEFKDVYEVMETLEVERNKKNPFNKAVPSLKQYKLDISKQYKPEVSFVGQNFMDVTHFLGDESSRISKESSNKLGNQDCSQHHFLKVFQEPNLLFRKYFHDLKSVAPSHLTSKKATFKSSNGAKTESEVCCSSERKMDRFAHVQNDVMSSFRIPRTVIASRSLKEHSDSLPRKLAQLRSAGKNYECIHPNHIVVLKPSIDKARRRVHLRTPENKFARRRLTAQTGFQEVHIGARDWLNFSKNVEVFGCKTKGSIEIDREFTEQLRESVRGSKKHASVLGLNNFSREDNSCVMSGRNNLCDSKGSSNHFNDWNSNYGSALVSTTEYMRKEVRKNFSGKWKMNGSSKVAGDSIKGSSTLAEMFALSDMEVQNTASSSSLVPNVSDEKSWGSPSSISSRDNWEDGFFINLPKLSSVPASSTNYRRQNLSSLHRFGDEHFCTFNNVLKLRSKKFNHRESSSLISIKSSNHKLYSDFGGEENNLPSQEIHMNQEKTRKGKLVKTTAEGNSKLLSVPSSVDVDMLMITNGKPPQLSMASIVLKNPKVSSTDLKEATLDCHQVDDKILAPLRMEEALQPCTVSVPELPLREDDSRCSESLTEYLLEPHRKALTSETVDPCAEASAVLTLSNEDNAEEWLSLQQSDYLEEEFMDEEERDYTYLLDILIVSGVHSAKQDKLCNTCFSPEYPVNPTLFEKLEKKYGKLVAWSQSERKLMFDLANSILAEILAPCMDLHPWVNSTRRIGPMWGSEGLVEKTWQMLVGKRIELNVCNAEDKVLDLKWLDLGDNVDEIGREIERMLEEELLEELVAEFIIE